MLARDLLEIKTLKKAEKWVSRFESWTMKHKEFLKEMTMDDRGVMRHTHERLIKAKTSLISLIKSGNLFTYLKEADEFPSPLSGDKQSHRGRCKCTASSDAQKPSWIIR